MGICWLVVKHTSLNYKFSYYIKDNLYLHFQLNRLYSLPKKGGPLAATPAWCWGQWAHTSSARLMCGPIGPRCMMHTAESRKLLWIGCSERENEFYIIYRVSAYSSFPGNYSKKFKIWTNCCWPGNKHDKKMLKRPHTNICEIPRRTGLGVKHRQEQVQNKTAWKEEVAN